MTPDDYRKQRGYWVVASIETNISWPTEHSISNFRNREILLSPSTHELYAGVGILLNSQKQDEFKENQKFIMEFLSSVVWYEDSPIWLKHWGGGGHFWSYGKPNNSVRETIQSPVRHEVKKLHIRNLPDSTDTNTRLALAFYREALSLEHYGYRFLSFYKIINLYVGSDGKKQISWINQNLNNLGDYEAQERHRQLTNMFQDVGEYLYGSCRCAVSHAGQGMTIDPENPSDQERLYHDMPLIRDLARMVIEKGYRIKSRQTIWKEHLYELSGFKNILGPEIVSKIVTNEIINLKDIPLFPKISICLAHSNRLSTNKTFDIFEALTTEVIEAKNGRLHLQCVNSNIAKVNLILDFSNEKLEFDPLNDFTWQDNGSSKAIEYAISYYEFLELLFSNAELEFWDHESKKLLSYCDPYLPRNIAACKIFELFAARKTLLGKELLKRKQDGVP